MIELEKTNEKSAEKMEVYRKEHGVSYTFIANRTNYAPSYVRRCLLKKNILSENLRKKINELWGTDF